MALLKLFGRAAQRRRLGLPLADRPHSMVFLDVDPQLAPLRDNPRFAALLTQVRLP